MRDIWKKDDLFVSSVYILEKPEFLEPCKKSFVDFIKFNEHLRKSGRIRYNNKLYPVAQTYNMNDEWLKDIQTYILDTARNILISQQYDMHGYETQLYAFWGQQHKKYSRHIEHIHGEGSQISGFYFLDTPENGCQIQLHDPRPGKRQIGPIWTEKFHYKVKSGDLVFINSWLGHGFTPNESDEPFNFIHFNIDLQHYNQKLNNLPPAEVI